MIKLIKKEEFRFVIPGKAVSFRSPHAKKYQELVGKVASKVIDAPFDVAVDVHIDYFHTSSLSEK